VDSRFSAENATHAKEAFSGKVDSRFSAENATTQRKHFPEKWTSGFPLKMRPRTTNPDAKPRATPGAFSCMGASDPSVVIARVIAAARARPDASVATTYFS
jgi:hypothetical protein